MSKSKVSTNLSNELTKPAEAIHVYEETKKHGCAKAIEYTILPNGCWQCESHHFNDRKTGNKYIQIHRRGKQMALHRFVWELANKHYVSRRDIVRHTCGNPRCISPDHLKRVGPSGKAGYMKRKLNMEDARAIRKEYWSSRSITQRELAVKYGVSQTCIHCIISNKTYREEPTPELDQAA